MQELNTVFYLIEKFAAIAATTNIDESNIKICNDNINVLLTGPVKKAIQEYTASSVGLII